MKQLFFTALAFCLSSCNCCNTKPALEATAWQLVELDGTKIECIDDSYTLSFDTEQHRAFGRGECNSYFYSYTIDDDNELALTSGGATRMMCPNQTQEDKFLNILNECESYLIEDNQLTITDSDSNTLVFVPIV